MIQIIASVLAGLVVIGLSVAMIVTLNNRKKEAEARQLAYSQRSKLHKESKELDDHIKKIDVSSSDALEKLKAFAATKTSTEEGKNHLDELVKKASHDIIRHHVKKALALDLKKSDDKFNNKNLLTSRLEEILKIKDYINLVDASFKQDKLSTTLEPLNKLISKFQDQIKVLSAADSQNANQSLTEAHTESDGAGASVANNHIEYSVNHYNEESGRSNTVSGSNSAVSHSEASAGNSVSSESPNSNTDQPSHESHVGVVEAPLVTDNSNQGAPVTEHSSVAEPEHQ